MKPREGLEICSGNFTLSQQDMNSLGHILLYPGLDEATLESNHSFKSLAQADKPHGLLYVIHLVDTHLQHEFYELEQPALGQLTSTIEIASTRLIGSA